MLKKRMPFIFMSVCFVFIAGCATQSTRLTRVPQQPLWQAQHLAGIKKPHHHQMKISVSKVRAQFLSQQSPDIQHAFLQYQTTGKAPIIQSNDFVQFPYSENSQPIVVCQPLNACDIALEKGETIISLRGGDTARWLYDEIYSGEGDTRQPHALVKPKFANISTDLIIATTKRTYHIGLLSKSDHYVKQATFYYPREMQRRLNTFNAQMVARLKNREATVIASVPSIDPEQLDDHYKITRPCCLFSHGPAWKPLRAFNDGTHVYIEMPALLRVTDAPVLFIQTRNGARELVNYRLRNNYYIVDQLFKRAVMVSGVGSAQEKILITYVG